MAGRPRYTIINQTRRSACARTSNRIPLRTPRLSQSCLSHAETRGLVLPDVYKQTPGKERGSGTLSQPPKVLRSLSLVSVMVCSGVSGRPTPMAMPRAARACPTWEPTTLYERAARLEVYTLPLSGCRSTAGTPNLPLRSALFHQTATAPTSTYSRPRESLVATLRRSHRCGSYR